MHTLVPIGIGVFFYLKMKDRHYSEFYLGHDLSIRRELILKETIRERIKAGKITKSDRKFALAVKTNALTTEISNNYATFLARRGYGVWVIGTGRFIGKNTINVIGTPLYIDGTNN